MVRCVFELSNGERMHYELFHPTGDRKTPIPFVVSVPGAGQQHVNGFSRRLASPKWAVAVPLKPKEAPLLFTGSGESGDGPWHIRELCNHLLADFAVDGGRFLFVGVSNGGNSVLRFATLWPELCYGLFVVTGALSVKKAEYDSSLAKLHGVPIEMYVGSEDEVGFCEPMQALKADLKAAGHKPVGSLTVLEGAGHCCSALLCDGLVLGTLWLMMLCAGMPSAVINPLELKVPPDKAKRMKAKDVLAKLCDLAGLLDLDGASDVDAAGLPCLRVKTKASDGIALSVSQAAVAPAAEKEASKPSVDYKAGDSVEVWSNTRQEWVSAIASKVCGKREMITVVFQGDKGKLSKEVPMEMAAKFLRKQQVLEAKQKDGGSKATSQDTPEYRIGDQLSIWSESKQDWYDDAEVVDVKANSVMVRFGCRAFSKEIPTKHTATHLRQRRTKRPEPTRNGSKGYVVQSTAETFINGPAAPAGRVGSPQPKAGTFIADHGENSGSSFLSGAGFAATSVSKGSSKTWRIGDKVAIWSESKGVWYKDGELVDVTPDSAFVVKFGGGKLKKAIPAAKSEQFLRPITD
eukprot:TRINITY_DN16043_c0_g1_i1.p1 TRINITY_DN16043_c0_g1~~TRINITY_DN16043_c0_g1_i1.p1  ORF type:complete len:575 (+),score=127.08 TRINITY_DN16043_c0_g1_i1:99-1823(+)